MKIETESLIFNKNVTLELLQSSLHLTDLQKQYLTYLVAQDSIEQLVVRLLNNGWLVNFQELYILIEKLVKSNAVLNPKFIQYFNSILRKFSISQTPLGAASNLQINLETLLELPFFRSLPKDLATLLIKKSSVKKYLTDSNICKTGNTDRNLFVILNGQAAIFKQFGNDNHFISVVSKNGIFGESSFLTGSAKSADIIATQTCDVLIVPYQKEILDPILNQAAAHGIVKRFWIQNALAQSDFFKKIPSDCLDSLTFSGKIITLKNEEILFKQNDVSSAAYLVVQGQIKIIQNGKIISTMPQGSFLGEVSLTMTNGIRTASAFSYQDTTLLEITRNDFYHLLSQNLFLAKEIQNLAYERLKKDKLR